MKMQVSELIVRFLEKLGIDTLFGMPGAHILPVYDSLYRSDIQTVLVKHEQGAAFMAGGLARATGHIGACITTAGPGATNLVTGIANAYADRLPVIAITGEAPTYIFGKGGLQESSGEGGSVDQSALFAGITRYHRMIERTDYLANVLGQCVKYLRAESPGPVVISIPYNVQKEQVDQSLLEQIAFQPRPGSSAVPGPLLDECVRLIAAAHSPLVIAGHGCLQSNARQQLNAMCTRLNIPVTTSLKGKGAIDEHSSLSLGSLGVTSAGYALQYLYEQADLVLMLGAAFNERTSYVWNDKLLKDVRLIQVDRDAHQLEKVFRADISIQADIGDFLSALNASSQTSPLPAKSIIDIPAYKKNIEQQAELDGSHIFDAKFDLIKTFYHHLEQRFTDGIMLFDDNITFAQNFYRVRAQDRFYPNSGVSSLGHAVPAAIGASFKVDIPVFALIGDGGFQMCAMEIMTAVNYQVPLNIVLFNNRTMGLIRKNQHQQFDERFIDCDFINPDYGALAQSFGISHHRIETDVHCQDLFAELDFEQGIHLIEVMLDQDAYPNYSAKR